MTIAHDIRKVIGQIDRLVGSAESEPPPVEWPQDREQFFGALHGAKGSLKGALVLLGEDPFVVLGHCSECDDDSGTIPCPSCSHQSAGPGETG